MTLAQLLLLLDQHVQAHQLPEKADGEPTPAAEPKFAPLSDLVALAGMRRE